MPEDQNSPIAKDADTQENPRAKSRFPRTHVLLQAGGRHFPNPLVIIIVILLVLILALSVRLIYFESSNSIGSRTVSFGLRNIGELATQSGYFTNVQVISDARQIFGFNIPFTSSKYIFSYDGLIKAGYDFSAIELDVDDDAHTIHVKLPQARILSIEIQEDSFTVYDESQSIFTPLNLADVNQSQVYLKEQASRNAISNGILDAARTNAETLIELFLSNTYDPQVYSIVFESADAAPAVEDAVIKDAAAEDVAVEENDVEGMR